MRRLRAAPMLLILANCAAMCRHAPPVVVPSPCLVQLRKGFLLTGDSAKVFKCAVNSAQHQGLAKTQDSKQLSLRFFHLQCDAVRDEFSKRLDVPLHAGLL